ncbi:hypothetical protein Tco_0616683 [Tanacetum coccineum]
MMLISATAAIAQEKNSKLNLEDTLHKHPYLELSLTLLLPSMTPMDQTEAKGHSKSKSSCPSNNFKKLEGNHRNSLIPKTQKHKSSECNNIKLAVRNAKSEVVCAMCKQCFVTGNHDVCMLNYVNDMNSRADNQSANVSKLENQKKHKANVRKSKELGSQGSLASSRHSKPRNCLWSGSNCEELFCSMSVKINCIQ